MNNYYFTILDDGEKIIKGDQYKDTKSHSDWQDADLYVGKTVSVKENGMYFRRLHATHTYVMAYKDACNRAQSEPGYDFLPFGETIKKGDEVFFSNGCLWEKSGDIGRVVGYNRFGQLVCGEMVYRRKVAVDETKEAYETACKSVKVGIGFRFLSIDEDIHEGDECFHVAQTPVWKGWVKTTCGGAGVRSVLGAAQGTVVYRRLLPNAVELLREEVARLNVELKEVYEEAYKEAQEWEKELEAANASYTKLNAQVNAMKKTASGNVVFVRKDGFSKPETIPMTFCYPLPSSVAPASVAPMEYPVSNSCAVLNGFNVTYFDRTNKTDGFGRVIYKEVA